MLSKLSIAKRIWLLSVFTIVLFASVYLYQMVLIQDQLLDTKKQRLLGLVSTAHSVMEGFDKLVSAGELSLEEAQSSAKRVIRDMRYDNGQYFWLNDMQPRMIMHPIKPGLEGRDLANSVDKRGKKFWLAFVDVVEQKGAGFVEYYWTPLGATDDSVELPKLSYIKGFKPWGWMVGSGVYIDDVYAEFQTILIKRVLFLVAILTLMGLLSWLIIRSILGPLNQTTRAMEDISQGDGDLTVRMPMESQDELARLASAFNDFVDKVRQTILDIHRCSDQLVGASRSMRSATEQSNHTLELHQQETDMVASALHEMSATVHEVASSAAEAAKLVGEVREGAVDGQNVVQQSVSGISDLAVSVDQATESIQNLESDVQNIGSILDVIRSIADQTNLLALNAAIEAARAGEQGRGFAVVADEVRNLAQRTQESTEEIQSMIAHLQTRANQAVTIIQSGRELAEVSVEQANEAGGTLNTITHDIQKISDMNTHIASATEQQSATVEMINQNVSNINAAFGQTTQSAQDVAKASGELNTLADHIEKLLSRFKVQ